MFASLIYFPENQRISPNEKDTTRVLESTIRQKKGPFSGELKGVFQAFRGCATWDV